MISITPAVLPKSFAEIEEALGRIRGAAPLVQVDICDGHYARHKTWPYTEHKTFDNLVRDEKGLPFWGELQYEFDLMVTEPAAVAESFATIGASRIIIHARSKDAPKAVNFLAEMRDRDDKEPGGVREVGVALTVDAQPMELEAFDDRFDFVQVMGIERIGRQGEPLDRHAFFLLERLRRLYPTLPLQIDGGVRKENIRELVAAGATQLVAGSAVFGEDDPIAALKALYTEANAQ